jgi:translation initiation factor IF-2
MQVRALRAPHGGQLKEVLPGQPAEIIGLRGMPQAGDSLMVGAGKTNRFCL